MHNRACLAGILLKTDHDAVFGRNDQRMDDVSEKCLLSVFHSGFAERKMIRQVFHRHLNILFVIDMMVRVQMMRFDRKGETAAAAQPAASVSRLNQWPCQIKLVPVQAPFFDGAKLLIAADCTAYAYARMHEDYMKGKITLIGCPKLDDVDYSEKLTAIIRDNDINAVTIVRMEVPCCGGLQRAAETALKNSGKFIPWQVVTISRDGNILE